jgi:hypothetical protein
LSINVYGKKIDVQSQTGENLAAVNAGEDLRKIVYRKTRNKHR